MDLNNGKADIVRKQFLFCPGPVNVAENVKKAVVNNEIGHREEEFSALISSLNKKLLKVYGTKNTSSYYAVFITGSGTAANEAILSSVVGDKHILIISNGEFGERLYEISKIHNKHTHHLRFEWAKLIDLEKVQQYLKNHTIDVIAMVHHETSTGMLNSIEKVGKLAKKHKAQFIVDTVSSGGAHVVDPEKCNIAFCSGSAAKAIASLPGVSFVIGKHSEFNKLKNISPKTTYLNLYKFYIYSKDYQQTPNTPAVQLFYALNQALSNILVEGVEARREHLRERAQLLRDGLKGLGLRFLINEKDMSSVLTTIMIPPQVTIDQLKTKLHERNIIVYNGKGPIANKVFQVGNIGEVNKEAIHLFLTALEEVLESLKNKSVSRKQTFQGNGDKKGSAVSQLPSAPLYVEKFAYETRKTGSTTDR